MSHEHIYPFEAEASLNTIKEFSPYLKENTTLHHYKHQFVNAVQRNNPRLHWESYRAHKYKMQLLIIKVTDTYGYHSALKG
jgi:hypothetical protein